MSKWQEAKPEDLEIDGENINIMLESDNEGNNYVEVKIKDIQKLLKKPNK